MTIDSDHLQRYRIPEARQRYGPRDCALYALSLGIGQDPLDESALAFVGGGAVVRPFPTLPLVLGHPGLWMARADTGIDVRHVVQVAQDIALLRPLPPSGTVIGSTRVLGLLDRGAAHDPVLYTERLLTDTRGLPLARMRASMVLRHAGRVAGPTLRPPPPDPAVPRVPPDWRQDLPTRPEQALYYRWSGDDNPLHRSPAAARAAGFERPVLHGLCTLGMAARAIVQGVLGWDAGRLRSLGGHFVRPVFPGDLLRARVWHSGQFQLLRAHDGKVVLDRGRFRAEPA